jgi:hypothetical protein
VVEKGWVVVWEEMGHVQRGHTSPKSSNVLNEMPRVSTQSANGEPRTRFPSHYGVVLWEAENDANDAPDHHAYLRSHLIRPA